MTSSVNASMSQSASAARSSKGRFLGKIQLGIIVVCGLLLALSANYDTLWFDEAYSVAMARHSFADIWTVGSSDVHPVLYYWMLHCVYLVFGDSIFAFRLVSIAGLIVLSLLGYTHIRRDFGDRAGFLFTVLVFLIPWSIRIAFQIRMYEWVAVVVMVGAIYGWRVVQRLLYCGREGEAQKRIPIHWWVVLCLSSAAAAYLHYYGAIAAFCIQFFVLIAILCCPIERTRNLAFWVLSAFIAVGLYVPWIMIAIGQTTTVSGGFWITFEYPSTFADLVLFPFNPPEFLLLTHYQIFGRDGNLCCIVLLLLVVLAEAVCIYLLGKERTFSRDGENSLKVKTGCLFFLGVYFGVAFIAGLASLLIDQPVLYYRYLAVAVGPLMLVIALVLSSLRTLWIRIACGLLVCTLSCFTYYSLYAAAYDPMNAECLIAYEEICDQVQEANGGEVLAVSDSEGTASIIAASEKGAPIIYLDAQKKYGAFEPQFILDPEWSTQLESYEGEVVFIGSEETAAWFADQFGGTLLSSEGHYHPYSNNWLIYSRIAL